MQTLLGRVVDTWQQGNSIGIVVDDGVTLQSWPWPNPLALGSWIRGTLSDAGALLEVELLSTPRQWNPTEDAIRWSKGRRERLWQRQTLRRALRNWFADQGFLEAETPLLVPGMAPDPHLDPISVESEYLITSTEYQVKRLFIGGFHRVFTLTKNFRKGEIGQWHNPEFTMLEWGRVGASLRAIEEDAEAAVRGAFLALRPDAGTLCRGDSEIDLLAPEWERLSLVEAFERYLGLRISEDFDLPQIHQELLRTQVVGRDALPRDPFEAISLLVDLVQPRLGHNRPTFLQGWPAFLTPSSAVLKGKPHLADRSELFIAGVELGDGFGFASDPVEQRRRFDESLRERQKLGKHPIALDQRYLSALELGLPPGAGMALGFDRLVMLLTGAPQIRDVLSFAWDER